MSPTDDILVIGAGPAGLAAVHELTRAGVRPRVVDGAARVAQPWRDRHDMLHLNTHRRFSALPGLRIPRAAGAFPHRDELVRYLEEYARRLPVEIEWGIRVQRVDRDDGRWRVRTDTGDLVASHVVLATGPDRVPTRPRWPGEADFPGQIRHAAQVNRPGDLAGHRVLIVGGGNSGIDLAGALSRVGPGRLWVSARHGVAVVPRRLGPMPVQPLAVWTRHAPVRYHDLSIGLVSRAAFGDLGRLGYPPPQHGALTLFRARGISPAADDGFVAALRRGDVSVVGPVTRLDRDGAVLADGRRIDPEVIVCATGYRPGLEPLVGHLGVLDGRGRPGVVAGPISGCPGLWFVGQCPPFPRQPVRPRTRGPPAGPPAAPTPSRLAR